jgi:hypothetical protein
MTEPRYKSEAELVSILKRFEDATIGRDEWKHAEHMVVALFYLREYDLATAVAKMRTGILDLLEKGFGLDLSKEMPYHQTITVFWMRLVSHHLSRSNGRSLLETANELAAYYDKDHPLKFYSKVLLFSDTARQQWVEPDLRAIESGTEGRSYRGHGEDRDEKAVTELTKN